MRNKALAAVLTVGLIGTAGAVWSSANEASGADVVRYMPTAKVSLQEGLKAAESEGQPISGKFEVDQGHLQLRVYTTKDGKFSEVLVDQSTGKVAKTESITDRWLAARMAPPEGGMCSAPATFGRQIVCRNGPATMRDSWYCTGDFLPAHPGRTVEPATEGPATVVPR